ncbi:hypothetical protein INT43_008332 [Umbelopsis isabellina]|uniref:Uncharacterized protein n=1 Tax=Mortierella isabellina TaxID=91625 RepID=A0A8H7U6Q7_MORIS|nr:hypothetical protein INT43_008332 [Umbelopsis isabellina]
MDVISSLENNPNYRFVPIGPDSAAGIIAAVFIILLAVWIYLALKCGKFLLGAVIRLLVYCALGAVGYILRIVCNSLLSSLHTTDEINNFVNLYIAANTLTALGNFFLFNAIAAVAKTWAACSRDPAHLRDNTMAMAFENKLYRYFNLATLVTMILNIVGSSNGSNSIRIASNAIFVALLVVLMFALAYYYVTFKSQPRPAYDILEPVGKQSTGWSHPDLIPGILFLCSFLLLIAQAFKLAQTLVPIGTPALTNIALIYIFSAVIDLIILIIMTIAWRPVFYFGLKDKQMALDRAQTEYDLEQQNTNSDGYPMNEQNYSASNQPGYYNQPANLPPATAPQGYYPPPPNPPPSNKQAHYNPPPTNPSYGGY